MNRLNVSGQTLLDVMLALGIGGIVSLGLAGLFTFGVEQFNLLREENFAQESNIQAAYFLKNHISQAVKTYCCGTGNNPRCSGGGGAAGTRGGIPIDYVLGGEAGENVNAEEPVGIPYGRIDCRSSNPGNFTGAANGTKYPIAMFIRENGAVSGDSGASTVVASAYVPTGLYFEPPRVLGGSAGGGGSLSGVLYITSLPAGGGGMLIPSTTDSFFDRLVHVGAVAGSATFSPTNGILQTIDYQITTRYFNKLGGPRDFRLDCASTSPIPPAGAKAAGLCIDNGNPNLFRDVTTTVSIGFRDNILGTVSDGSGMNTVERLHGGIYYFKVITPPLTALRF